MSVWTRIARIVRRGRAQGLPPGLGLDPDCLPMPAPPPGPNDFVICGSPRSGTTLLAAALFQPPTVVTVVEPLAGLRLPPAELFAALRGELGRSGRLVGSRLDLTALLADGTVRWRARGASRAKVAFTDATLVGVKWPCYWRLIDHLPDTKFLVCARHPYDVISSYERSGGRLAEGLEHDVAFHARMNERLTAATTDPELRRAMLFDHIHSHLTRVAERDHVMVVRYERWFCDPVALLREIGAFLDVELGPGPAVVRRPAARRLTERQRDLVRDRCRTAGSLAYELD